MNFKLVNIFSFIALLCKIATASWLGSKENLHPEQQFFHHHHHQQHTTPLLKQSFQSIKAPPFNHLQQASQLMLVESTRHPPMNIIEQEPIVKKLSQIPHPYPMSKANENFHQFANSNFKSNSNRRQEEVSRPEPQQMKHPPAQLNTQKDDSQRLLICHYTTRQMAPTWPKDAREYVVRADGAGLVPANSVQDFNGETNFVNQPQLMQYEPLTRSLNTNQNQETAGTAAAAAQQGEIGNTNMKNQQQQLVFKSAGGMFQATLTGNNNNNNNNNHPAVIHLSPIVHHTSSQPNNNGKQAMNNNNNNNNLKQHNSVESITQLEAIEHQQQPVHFHANSPLSFQQQQQQQQQMLLIGEPKGLMMSASDKNLNKNKQTLPIYSFIEETNNNNNNGLIVGDSRQGNLANSNGFSNSNNIASSASPLPLNQHNGDNGNANFIISGANNNININKDNNNNGNHQERANSMKQQQQTQALQLVFAPPSGRTFSASGGSTSANINNNNNNYNEFSDTKSQLFMPSSQQQHISFHHQPSVGGFKATPTTHSANSVLFQKQHEEAGMSLLKLQQQQKGLGSAPIPSEQLSAAASSSSGQVEFSGAVSSASPVPLSSASSSLIQAANSGNGAVSSSTPFQRNLLQPQQQAQQQQQQFVFAPATSQLIVGQKSPTASSTGSASAPSLSSANNNLSNNNNNNNNLKLGYPQTTQLSLGESVKGASLASPPPSSLNAASSVALAISQPALVASSSSPSSHLQSSSSTSQQLSSGAYSAASSAQAAGSANSNSNSNNNNNNNNSGGGGLSTASSSLSSALVSSPLSTMFDVFGAASQYLMRFKPSSLMSPGALTFNTISTLDHNNNNNNRNHHNQQQHHHHQQQQLRNQQQVKLENGSSSLVSLIPLPFGGGGGLGSMQKSFSANDRSGSSSSSSSSLPILSRFSLQHNQRREDVCGRTIQTPQRRIIGGEGARYGEFPYQVHIKIAKHQCGGALVDRQSIITAAHCVYHFITRAPVSKLQIVIGAYDIEDEQYQELPPQYFKVNKVKLHPNFRFSASHPDRYDVAILKLDKPVKYTDNVLPVCLPSKELKFESQVGTVTGFGKTDPSLSNRYGTRLLQKVDVPIIDNNECERWHRTRGIDLKIFPEMMCAGYEDGLKDACVGDSGGPLVVKTAAGPNGAFRWTLAGITSAGFGCAQSRQPGIYHRVSHTVDWILQNLD